jgi:hypothetical protein
MNILDIIVLSQLNQAQLAVTCSAVAAKAAIAKSACALRVLSCCVHKNISSSKSKKKISQVLIITGVINIVSLIMILSKSKQLEFLSR